MSRSLPSLRQDPLPTHRGDFAAPRACHHSSLLQFEDQVPATGDTRSTADPKLGSTGLAQMMTVNCSILGQTPSQRSTAPPSQGGATAREVSPKAGTQPGSARYKPLRSTSHSQRIPPRVFLGQTRHRNSRGLGYRDPSVCPEEPSAAGRRLRAGDYGREGIGSWGMKLEKGNI